MNALIFGIVLTFVWQAGDTSHTGFNLKYGTRAIHETNINVGNVLTYTKDFVFTAPDKNCFVVTAYNAVGESAPSNEVCANSPGKPISLAIKVNP